MKSRIAAAALVAATALAGCGGSGRLSSSDLHTQATRICSLATRQSTRIPTPTSPAGSLAFLRQGIVVLTPELAQLHKLRPPQDVADVYSASIAASAKKLDLLRTAAREIFRGADPVDTMQTLQRQLGPVVSQENGGWQALGLSACVNR